MNYNLRLPRLLVVFVTLSTMFWSNAAVHAVGPLTSAVALPSTCQSIPESAKDTTGDISVAEPERPASQYGPQRSIAQQGNNVGQWRGSSDPVAGIQSTVLEQKPNTDVAFSADSYWTSMPAQPREAAPASGEIAGHMLRAVVLRRQHSGCPVTLPNAKLMLAAQTHSQDMAGQNLLDHLGSDGSLPHERAERVGYSFRWVGETIAVGLSMTPEEILDLWMSSSSHSDIILDCTAREIGVGYDNRYWTLLLAASN